MSIGVIDLFCGIGGMTYGLEQAGIKVIAGIDNESKCWSGYATNNDSIFIPLDITDVSGDDLLHLWSDTETKVLSFSAPCQPFSSANQTNREDSHPSVNLLDETLRLIKESLPDILISENVSGLLNSPIHHNFCNELESLGYTYDVQLHDLSQYGLPQKRKRVLLTASLEGFPLTLPPPTNERVTVRNAIGHLEPIKAGEISKDDPFHRAKPLTELAMKRIKQSRPGGNWTEWNDKSLIPIARRMRKSKFLDRYGRLSWDKPSVVIITTFNQYGGNRTGHPEQHRALSLREGAILQGFPESFWFDPSVSDKMNARFIGNAVPPIMGYLIGQQLKWLD